MAGDWASEAATKLKQQLEARRQSDAMQLQQEAWRKEQGSKLWSQIRQIVKDRCDGLNREFERQIAFFQVVQHSQIHVILIVPGFDRRELVANFSPTSAEDALNWGTSGHASGSSPTFQYELAIENGKVLLQRDLIDVDTPEEVADRMMNALLVE